jgi:hypothetical protein
MKSQIRFRISEPYVPRDVEAIYQDIKGKIRQLNSMALSGENSEAATGAIVKLAHDTCGNILSLWKGTTTERHIQNVAARAQYFPALFTNHIDSPFDDSSKMMSKLVLLPVVGAEKGTGKRGTRRRGRPVKIDNLNLALWEFVVGVKNPNTLCISKDGGHSAEDMISNKVRAELSKPKKTLYQWARAFVDCIEKYMDERLENTDNPSSFYKIIIERQEQREMSRSKSLVLNPESEENAFRNSFIDNAFRRMPKFERYINLHKYDD